MTIIRWIAATLAALINPLPFPNERALVSLRHCSQMSEAKEFVFRASWPVAADLWKCQFKRSTLLDTVDNLQL